MNTATEQPIEKEPFFTRDSGFYKTLFRMLLVVAMQNLVAYSVNMADISTLVRMNRAKVHWSRDRYLVPSATIAAESVNR